MSEQETDGDAGPILVTLDGGEGGKDALELARVLSLIEERECAAATCLQYGPVSVRRANLEDLDVEVEPIFDEARQALSDPALATHVIGGRSPGRMLVEFAVRENAGTIVLGAPHPNNLAEALLGSTGERVFHHARSEVAVAPRGYSTERHDGLELIAVAYDGSSQGDAALARACDLAVRSGAKIEILVADDPVINGPDEEGAASRPRTASGVLREAIESVGKGLEVSGRVLEGAWSQGENLIARALSLACESDVDLLVTGSRRHGPIDRMILGSVTTELVKNPPCPVLVMLHR